MRTGHPGSFVGKTVSVEWYRATPNTALAGMQPKCGADRVAGSGQITSLCLLQDDRPGVCVDGVGDVPLAAVKTCDGQPVDQADLHSWFVHELSAWCLRHGGNPQPNMLSNAAELAAYAKTLR